MDYILEIIVSEKEMKKVELSEKMVEWGESIYSYNPRQYETKSKIIFEQVENVKYYENMVGKNLGKDMIILTPKNRSIFDLEYDANQKASLIKANELAVFLDSLFQLEEFYIFLTRDDEQVKERYRIEGKGEIIDKLAESLNWLNPKDILLFKDKVLKDI